MKSFLRMFVFLSIDVRLISWKSKIRLHFIRFVCNHFNWIEKYHDGLFADRSVVKLFESPHGTGKRWRRRRRQRNSLRMYSRRKRTRNIDTNNHIERIVTHHTQVDTRELKTKRKETNKKNDEFNSRKFFFACVVFVTGKKSMYLFRFVYYFGGFHECTERTHHVM